MMIGLKSSRSYNTMHFLRVLIFALCGSGLLLVSAEGSSRVLQKRSDDSSPLTALVQTLSQHVSENDAKIAALEAKLSKHYDMIISFV